MHHVLYVTCSCVDQTLTHISVASDTVEWNDHHEYMQQSSSKTHRTLHSCKKLIEYNSPFSRPYELQD